MIHGVDLYQAWISQLKFLLERPVVSPRNKICRESIGLQLCIGDARKNIIFDPVRQLNYRFLVAQWLTTQLGLEDKLLEKFNKHLADYETDGQGGVYPSYGPRLKPQWPFIMRCFQQDPQTRQAVMSIWEAQPINFGQGHPVTLYVPCTLSLQFLLRENLLHTVVNMRSSDAWLGIPYDVFSFTMLSNYLCGALSQLFHRRINLGGIMLHLGSSHLYEEHWEKAAAIVKEPMGSCGESPLLPPRFDIPAGLDINLANPTANPEASALATMPMPWKLYGWVLRETTNAAAEALLQNLERYAREQGPILH